MPRILAFTFSILMSITGIAQTDTIFIRYDKNPFDDDFRYEIDTILSSNNQWPIPLVGTMVLPSTTNQQRAKNYGLYLNAVSVSACSNTREPSEKDHIVNILETDTSLVIETKIMANCCHDFLGDVEIINGTIINLIYHAYGELYCSCSCCFGLSYHFSRLPAEEFQALKGLVLNGQQQTFVPKE